MAISLRYFIITIIAIFLSLGIGIFIGAIMDSQQLFITHQKQLVSGIEEEFDQFKEKNYRLLTELEKVKKENENKNIFLNNVFEYLIKDTLKGLNILTINVSQQQNFEDIINVFYNSGAKRVSQLIIKDFDSEELIVQTINESSIDIEEKVNNNLSGKNRVKEILNQILTQDFEYRSEEASSKNSSLIDYVVIFDGSYKDINKKAELVELIIEEMEKNKIPFVAVERSNSKYSAIPFYKDLGVSTVDNIETKIGQISMLMLINGNEGNYGEKETADKLMPENFLVFD